MVPPRHGVIHLHCMVLLDQGEFRLLSCWRELCRARILQAGRQIRQGLCPEELEMQPKQNIESEPSFAAQIPIMKFHLRIEEGICSSKEWAEGRHWCRWLGSVTSSLWLTTGMLFSGCLLWSSPERGGLPGAGPGTEGPRAAMTTGDCCHLPGSLCDCPGSAALSKSVEESDIGRPQYITQVTAKDGRLLSTVIKALGAQSFQDL
ncbi:E3 ubiquitin-protein ligase MARCHF2 isoform X6 [Motacilla alba alba]|uniref:E3 ubiquitin-protein ligase MARCHF2 isoform X6 n=1 Tax=Motacilla alba alba TaxID=1094192 RepID=UPI0018D551F8|nr:E3 ubiquitin-protein ligase MARCHF2 isoform X6 [Motacilla alba alba]